MRTRIFELVWVTVVLILLTLVIWGMDLDMAFARKIFAQTGQWPGINRFPWSALYDWAPLPGFILAGGALCLLLAGFFNATLKKVRKDALLVVLLLALGPGLVVNVLLKDQLGRARPREVVEFGGQYQFTQIWQRGSSGANSSFPSGHASVAFFLMAPWFVLRRKRKKLAVFALGVGLLFGSSVGLARALQGGHFLSDVVWAGGIVYCCGGILALIFYRSPPSAADPPGKGQETLLR